MKKITKELFPYIIIIIVVVLIRSYIVTPVIVSGDSMVPTLDDKQILLLNKIDYRFNEIKRNDNRTAEGIQDKCWSIRHSKWTVWSGNENKGT